ncbi:recombination protein RecR [Candidatus Poribacteria bacterium]|jgi:recombination protein RecR|nr:recombination protein RecR [Candidatus Poribacteria bacterium]MBT5536411.1 recombination protein RecR [Candidatus Poribacteria bacterium]MBT5710770.1 recombination protein RecR [Candidatus Poribacteria bacterium]MBT7097102.1 recombination protein RecR [Candidatus Poribacteria bacterium]MBT7809570.1 recombination protein RecR [Candidatus Poribacteria bacterium]
MRYFPDSLMRLLTELQKLPGVGPKTAQRLAFHLLKEPAEDARRLGAAIGTIHEKLTNCSICGSITELHDDPCRICEHPQRDHKVICVVEDADDVSIFERTGTYTGMYHVLGGLLSALNHVRPEDLRIPELVNRLGDGEVTEVIFALSPSVEGSATVTYMLQHLTPHDIRVTQIAYGVPIGSDLDYVDDVTLSQALEARNEVT